MGKPNPSHLKGRKLKGSGWFITANTNKREEKLGEEKIQLLKKTIQELFTEPKNLAQILNFHVDARTKNNRPELSMPKLEAIESYVCFPISFEFVIERSKKNGGESAVHAHGLVGIHHYSLIQLSSPKIQDFINEKTNLKTNVHFGGKIDGEDIVFRSFPSENQVHRIMKYAGKDLRVEGDYFGPEDYSIKQFRERYSEESSSEDEKSEEESEEK